MKITTVCFLQPYFKHLGHFSDFLVIFSSCTTSVFVRIISGGCFDGCLSLCRSELRDRSCSGISSSSRTGLRLTDGGWDRWSRWSDSEWSAESWLWACVCLQVRWWGWRSSGLVMVRWASVCEEDLNTDSASSSAECRKTAPQVRVFRELSMITRGQELY